MKNRIFTLSIREIKSQFFRFLSLLVMAFLGVFVYVGLKSTAPDMLKSLDDAYDEAAIYDLKLSSNLNFSKSELCKLITLIPYTSTSFYDIILSYKGGPTYK